MKSSKIRNKLPVGVSLGLVIVGAALVIWFWPFSDLPFRIEGFATEKQTTFVSFDSTDPLSKKFSTEDSTSSATVGKKQVANDAESLKSQLLRDLLPESQTNSLKQGATATLPPDFPKIAVADWRIQLVGPDHKLAHEMDESQLTEISSSERLDKRVADSFADLTQGAADAGVTIAVVSAYRSVADQTAVFNEKFERMKRQGKSDEEAERETMTDMTRPGYSEHHTGLAVDVVDESWLASDPAWTLEESYGATKGGQWLAAHVADYGFVIRYPADKTAITKISYEPWHLRYVGKDVAKYMNAHGLCLEEFVAEAEKWEQYGN